MGMRVFDWYLLIFLVEIRLLCGTGVVWNVERFNDILRDLYPPSGLLLHHVYSSSEHQFTYYDPIYSTSFAGFKEKYLFTNLTLQSLLSESSNMSCCHYYSSDILSSPLSLLFDSSVMNNLFKARVSFGMSANIWIAQGGIAATAHYDAVNNLFIQLKGTKTILLYPPRKVMKMFVYGRFHPHSCQSRLDQYCCVSNLSYSPYSILQDQHVSIVLTPCDQIPSPIEIALNPGDAIVIPPFWFHKTISQSASMSLSFWWETDESQLFDEMLSLPLPFESSWSPTKLRHVGDIYLNKLIEEADKQFNLVYEQYSSDTMLEYGTGDMIRMLLRQRYWEDVENEKVCNGQNSEIGKEELSKIVDYAKNIVAIAIQGMVVASLADRNALGSVLDHDDDDMSSYKYSTYRIIKKYGIRLAPFNVTPDRSMLLDRQAILAMKLCDYIEEVYFTLASLISPEASNVDKVRKAVEFMLDHFIKQ